MIIKDWYSLKDKMKLGKDKGPKNRHSKKGYQYDKAYRKEQRKKLRADRHKLFLTGELNEIYKKIDEMLDKQYSELYYVEYNSLSNKYGWNLFTFIMDNKND